MTTMSFRHEALRCTGPDAFSGAVTSLLGRGVRAGEACALLAPGTHIDAARVALDTDADLISFFDMSVAGRNPARILPAMQHLVDTHPEQRICWLAVLPVAGPPSALATEVGMHEYLLALPDVSAWDGRLCCLYDPSELSADEVSEIETRHRTTPVDDPDAVLRAAMRAPLPPPPAGVETRSIDLTTLGALRRSIREFGGSSGLCAERVDDLVYAVNEAVTNSICHGEGQARLAMWTEAGYVVCEVRDRGRIRDPLAGRVAPEPGQSSGRGLWLVNHLCDLVQLRSSEVGTVVRMYVES